MDIVIRRLRAPDAYTASAVTGVMASVFGEGKGSSPDRLAVMLRDDRFWLFGAFHDGVPVGGLTAHVIPVTHQEGHELFIYDVAVLASHQRKGIGSKLIRAAIGEAKERGLLSAFVPVDNEDQHALDFYRSLGGQAQAVTIFDF